MTVLTDQETTISLGRTDDVVRIWTSDVRHLRLLRKLSRTHQDLVREVSGWDDSADFEVSGKFFHLVSALRKKRNLTEAERASRAERLAGVRARQGTVESRENDG